MENVYKPELMEVLQVKQHTVDVKSVRIKFRDPAAGEKFNFNVGQFGMFSAFGAGESTFNICSSSNWKDYLEFCFRKTGKVTETLWQIDEGDTIGFRGPYGNAYPFEEWKGKNLIFYAVLATIIVPFQVIMIPVYLMVLRLNMVDSVSNFAGFAGLILPFAVNAFGIFLMRQAFLSIPKELEEAAVIDGCTTFDIWWRIFIPLAKPALATLTIFTFMGAWSEFLWPSIVLTKQEMYTLPVGLTHLQGVFSANWRYISAGAILSIIPILILFLALQRYFISGTTQGAVKG
jgi:ABC-type spermidine/putrescine transport system permease subunit II